MAYRIDRARVPETILEMAPYLVVHGSDAREDFVRDYLVKWNQRTDTLFVLEARDENNTLVAFLIATLERDFVHVAQAWSKPGIPWDVMGSMFQRTILWAASLDRFEIHAETKRDLGALFRRYGFVEHTVNVKYEIPDTIFDRFLEMNNGK